MWQTAAYGRVALAGVSYMLYWVTKTSNLNSLLMSKVKTLKKIYIYTHVRVEYTVYIQQKSGEGLKYWCPHTKERKQKKNPIFHFQKCHHPHPHMRECPLMGMCK